jgi:hypothetical protein
MSDADAPKTFRDLPWFDERQPLAVSECSHCGAETREYAYNVFAHNVDFMRALQAIGRPAKKKDLRKFLKVAGNDGAWVWRWGLIVSEGASNRGPWRLTKRGVRFLHGVCAIPSRCVVRITGTGSHSPIVRYEGPPIGVSDVERADERLYDEKAAEMRAARRNT